MTFAQALHAAVSKDIFSTNWVKISGREYRAGIWTWNMKCLCALQDNQDTSSQSVIHFLLRKLVFDHFSEQFQAYQIFESDEKDVIKADSLVIYKPFDIKSAYG